MACTVVPGLHLVWHAQHTCEGGTPTMRMKPGSVSIFSLGMFLCKEISGCELGCPHLQEGAAMHVWALSSSRRRLSNYSSLTCTSSPPVVSSMRGSPAGKIERKLSVDPTACVQERVGLIEGIWAADADSAAHSLLQPGRLPIKRGIQAAPARPQPAASPARSCSAPAPPRSQCPAGSAHPGSPR